jgi:quercetin dioxygenase-like cupin family protein
MPVVRHIHQLPTRHGPGWSQQDWADAAIFGAAVPMRARRYRLDAGATGPGIAPGKAEEAFVYVIAGAGTGIAGGQRYPLARESVLWLTGCDGIGVTAGPDGLDLLAAESTGPAGPGPASTGPVSTGPVSTGPVSTGAAGTGLASAGPMVAGRLFAAGELPHLVSTRDTRDRLDLVTDDVPVGARLIRADRIVYHRGDTAAAHYHTDCHHVFCVLAGAGLLHAGGQACRLEAGMSALVGPGEVHWFSADGQQDFSFVEFWAPPPTGTVWTVPGDRCTWAPARPPVEASRGRPA